MPVGESTPRVNSRLKNIKAPGSADLFDYLYAHHLDATYIPEDSDGYKIVEAGLVLAKALVDTDATYGDHYKLVPYNESASYGTGSDTAVGVLDVQVDVTHCDEMVSVIYHGKLIEANCRVLGEDSIPAAAKTDLPDIYWV